MRFSIVILLCYLITACMPYTRSPFRITQFCPYPTEQTQEALRYVNKVYEVDSFYLSLYCAYGEPIALLGCTTPSREVSYKFDIYILEYATKYEKSLIYDHELCHVFEVNVLNLPVESARHQGWINKV